MSCYLARPEIHRVHVRRGGAVLLATTAAFVLLAGTEAQAYRLWTDPPCLNVGAMDPDCLGFDPIILSDTISVDVHLDTEGQSNLVLLSMALLFDTTGVSYLPSSSYAASYILYSPGVGAQPASWMEPQVPPPSTVFYNPPVEMAPGTVVIAFIQTNFHGTYATTTDTLLAHLAFHVIGSGISTMSLAIGPGGTAVQTGDGTVISSQVKIGPVPEPATAVLVALGLVGLGLIASRRLG